MYLNKKNVKKFAILKSYSFKIRYTKSGKLYEANL